MPLKRRYVRIAERVLGRSLPSGACVHHVDLDRRNDRNTNLVILQDQSEHSQLHRRLRILRAGGNPWTQQICCTCRRVLDLALFPPTKRRYSSECLPCSAERNNLRYQVKQGRPARRLTTEERSAIQRANANRRWHPVEMAV